VPYFYLGVGSLVIVFIESKKSGTGGNTHKNLLKINRLDINLMALTLTLGW
jgi:hypothetical protein